jgi:hypothetical protein
LRRTVLVSDGTGWYWSVLTSEETAAQWYAHEHRIPRCDPGGIVAIDSGE